jgi:RimJ/RimL family protein N-acetyltransferase
VLLYGADKDVREWVSQGLFDSPYAFCETDIAIGIVKNNKLIAGVVYNNYMPEVSIEMSIYSIDKRWAIRHNLKALFNYPFTQLRLRRVTALCSSNERDVMKFLERLGFKQEGIHREAHPQGGDSVSYGMLRNECRYI